MFDEYDECEYVTAGFRDVCRLVVAGPPPPSARCLVGISGNDDGADPPVDRLVR